MISNADLAIVLEYAYRGVAAQGGKNSCHNDREPGCALCDALTAAEKELEADPRGEWDLDPVWWTTSIHGRIWNWITWRWRQVRWNARWLLIKVRGVE